MRAFFLYAVLVPLSVCSYGQSVDSLRRAIEVAPDSIRFEVAMDAMRALLDKDNEAALELSLAAISIAVERGDSLSITKGFYAQSYILKQMEQYQEAITVAKKAIAIAKRNRFDNEQGRALNNIAICYTFLSNYDKALEHYLQSLMLNEKLGRIDAASITLNNIGLVYYKLSNCEEAISYYTKSLEYKQKVKSNYDLDRLYINMALCHTALGNYSAAEDFITKALGICGPACSPIILVEAKYGLGNIYKAQDKLDLSEGQFQEALQIARQQGEKRFEIESLTNLGFINAKREQYDSALVYLAEAASLAQRYKYSQILLNVYTIYTDVYGNLKDYKNEALYSKKYSSLKDSTFSTELIKNLATIQADYSERENLSTIADNEKVIRAQRLLNYAVAFIVVMAFGFIYLIMRNSRTIRSLNSKLTIEVEKKTKELVRTNHYLKQVNDELDNLVYKTSHDIRGPLATLKGVCNVALMDVKDQEALAFLQKLDVTSTQLNQVLDKFSRVNEIYNTHVVPRPTNISNVVHEILDSQSRIERLKPIEVLTEIGAVEGFETEPRLLYYVLNSVIDNAFRYYNESKRLTSYVKVIVESAGDDVVIHVIDNGVGIPINIDSDSLFHMFTRGSERSLTGGMGLFIATIATRKLQGEIEFQRSADFLVTEFVITLPRKMDIARIEKPRERGSQAPSQRTQVDYKDYQTSVQ